MNGLRALRRSMKIAGGPPPAAARSKTTVAAGRGGLGVEDGSTVIDMRGRETSGSGASLYQKIAGGAHADPRSPAAALQVARQRHGCEHDRQSRAQAS